MTFSTTRLRSPLDSIRSLAARATLCALLAVAAPSIASAQPRVVVMADPATRDARADALRVELASRGTEVVLTDAPPGDTRMVRAANAQATARATGAAGAVWSDTIDGAAGSIAVVRVAPSADADVRQAPLPASEAADPRAFALIAASLLEEMLGPPEPPPAIVAMTEIDLHASADGSVDVHVSLPTAPAPPIADDAYAIPADELALPAPEPSLVSLYGAVALGAVALWSDVDFDGGPFVRGTIGLRIGGTLRMGIEHESAMLVQENRSSLHTGFRLGATIGFDVAVGDLLILVGGHARAVLTDLDPGPFFSSGDEWSWGISAGGSLGIAIPLDGLLHLDLAVEVDGYAIDVSGTTPWAAPALVAGISWL